MWSVRYLRETLVEPAAWPRQLAPQLLTLPACLPRFGPEQSLVVRLGWTEQSLARRRGRTDQSPALRQGRPHHHLVAPCSLREQNFLQVIQVELLLRAPPTVHFRPPLLSQ